MSRSNRIRGENRFYRLITLPAVAFLLLLMVYPLVNSFITSLTNLNLASPEEVRGVGLGNYLHAFTDPQFLSSLATNAWFTLISVSTQLVAGLFIAYFLSRQTLRGRSAYRTLLLLPMFVAGVVVGFQWKWIFISQYGVLNQVLHAVFGLNEIYWLDNLTLAKVSIVICDNWTAIPFMVLVLHASMQSIDRDLTDAAQIDGASGWQQLQYVILPAIKGAILVVLLIRVMDSIKTFDEVYILTSGGPANDTELISLYVFRQAFTNFNMGYASALSYVQFLLIIVFSVTLIRAFARR